MFMLNKIFESESYDGTEPVILLRPEDMRARPDHQLPMHSCVDWEIYNDNNEW